MAIVRESGANELYFQAIRKGAINGATDNKLEIVLDIAVPYSPKLTDSAREYMKGAIAQLQAFNPDLVAGAVWGPGCLAFIQAAKEMNYTASAFLMSVCASDSSTFKSVLGDTGRYVSGTTVWDRRLTGRMYNEDGSSSIHFFRYTVSNAKH